jgi:hypothetical protein
MPIKPSVRGTTTVSVHVPRLSEPPPLAVFRLPFDTGVAHAPTSRLPSTSTRTSPDPMHTIITSLPPLISVSPIGRSASAAVTQPRPLKDYRITSLAVLPAPNAQGISLFKGRQYVNVPDGGTVQIAADPVSGLYRAKLPSELTPSGPVLQPDADGSLWRPVEPLAPLIYPLSTTRLEAFRTDLDFSTIAPDSNRLYHLNGKLYVVIEQRAYQVLHDLDASTPRRTVMRIVRAEDPVATHENNIYVASRPGRSEPIVFDNRHGWRGTNVSGAAGMRRRVAQPSAAAAFEYAEMTAELTAINYHINHDDVERQRLLDAWTEVKDLVGENGRVGIGELSIKLTAIVNREWHSREELMRLDRALKYHERNKSAIRLVKTRDAYEKDVIALQKRQMFAHQQLIEFGLTRRSLQGPLLNLHPQQLPRTVGFLGRLLHRMKKRQVIADNLMKKWKLSADDLGEDVISPKDTHNVVASWVLAKSVLLDSPQSTGDTPQASDLAVQFGQVTYIYGALDSIPRASHASVLSGLSQQCAAIRAWYDRLELPVGPLHETSRNEINVEISAFEQTLATRLTRDYNEQAERLAQPVHEQPIDFDFIPPQQRSGPVATPWRLFRAKKNGISRINVGHPRRTDRGDEVIDVGNPFDPRQPGQTYERKDGEWHPAPPVQHKRGAALSAEARHLLRQCDSYVDAALKQERNKNNPDNIVEALEAKARVLEGTALQLRQLETTDADVVPLIQSLEQQSQRLQDVGEEIRLRIYKDKDYLSIDRLIYLIDKGQIKVHKNGARKKEGAQDFLDVYSLIDATSNDELWHAHFHYPALDTRNLNFNVRGAHLKTLEQSRMGGSLQRRAQQEGREHIAIWREYFDGRTAQRIFALAAASTQRVDTGQPPRPT